MGKTIGFSGRFAYALRLSGSLFLFATGFAGSAPTDTAGSALLLQERIVVGTRAAKLASFHKKDAEAEEEKRQQDDGNGQSDDDKHGG
jgi:hypothetical protein